MSKKRGLSAEEKRSKMQELFLETVNLELEKLNVVERRFYT